MSLCVSAEPTTIYVPDDYLTIQGAVNGANSGDIIIVRDGNYTENINVNKINLTIKSENGAEKTIIRVAEGNYVIRVTSDYTKITGFTVEGTCYNCLYGGLYVNAKNSNISHNIITQSGITLGPSSTNSIIFNNNISDSAAGIHVDGASDSTFIQNYVSNNKYGFYIEDYSPYWCGSAWCRTYPINNSFISNIASNNEFGIELRNCMNSFFIDNIIIDNGWYGIRWDYSTNNILTGNIMSGNRYNFYLYGDSDAHFNNNIDASNLVNGKPIYYIKNAENQVYDSSTNAGIFYCINCHNVIIKDLTLSKNEFAVYLWKTTNSKIENVNVGSNRVGIRLGYSDNNTIINNNALSNDYTGILLGNSNNNTLISNTANLNRQGIILSSSNSNTLKYNNASLNFGSGISLDNAWYNTLTNNSANLNGNESWGCSLYGAEGSTDGIYLWSSSNNILANNNVLDNVCFGIKLHGSENNTLTNNVASGNRYNFAVDEYDDIGLINNIDTSNLVNGRPIYYIQNAENQVYGSSTNAGVFYCINCHNISIKDLILSKNYPGVYFWKTNNSRVENVSVLNNTYGIQLRYSNYNIFINSNVSNNREGNGMDMLYSNNNSFINNIFFNNRGAVSIGISDNNKIYHNNFLNNTYKPSVYSSTGNLFDNGYSSGGNHWNDYTGIDEKKGPNQNESGSDGIGDTPYTFTGSQDRYPFMNESGWLTLAPTCYDNIKNQDETDIDCGGSCSSCEDGKSCLQKADCLSNYCNPNKICFVPLCNDGWKNGDETGIDCGGSCPVCLPPPPSCSDGIQNWFEEGIDCGGICENKCEYRLKLLFIPISWEGSYEDFKSAANEMGNFFVGMTPLKDCKQYAKIIISGNEDYGPAWSNWNCKADAASWYSGGVRGALFDTHACAVEYWARTHKGYDYVIGLADYDVCYMTGGCGVSGLSMWKLSAIIAEAYIPPLFILMDKASTAHELGHKFDLKDQYCNCIDTWWEPNRWRCGPHVSPNPLKVTLGCDYDGNCCWEEEGNEPYWGCVWCDGNLAMDSDKRTVMSMYDDADGFSIDEFNYLKSKGLECPFESASLMKMSILGAEENVADVVLELMIEITNNDSIMNTSIGVTSGNPLSQESAGNYSLIVLDNKNTTLYNSSFELEFIVSGIFEPLNETIIYDKIRYNTSMRKIQLHHNGNLIFQQEINFCDFDNRCEVNESHFSCPNDCESWANDGICNNEYDGVCDLNCLARYDPDCEERINITLIKDWNLISIPLEIRNISIDYLFNNTNITIYGYKNNSWFVPEEIDNKLGYWLKINESLNLTLIGTEVEDKTIELNNGWNLIGYPYINEIGINNSDLRNYTTFTYMNNSWSSYVPNRIFNSLQILKPGYGYWVKK